MDLKLYDTIAAISTALGAGGIGIVRISGKKSVEILEKIFRCGRKTLSHELAYGHVVDENGQIIDEVMAVKMLAPRSYTKEDIVEINCHGGIKSLQAVLTEVLKNGARMAEPGEFTKRAFLNGRIDLTKAEAVMELISAKTEASRKAAAVKLNGGLYKSINGMAQKVLLMLAHIEASIDYPEHELEQMNLSEIYFQGKNLVEELDKLIKNSGKGKILREGLETVILGRPNVGKSSLLNVLLDEDRAIVTDIPGTTRDVIQEYVDIGGIPLKISDTAGIRKTDDIIEKIGVEKSLELANSAELILLVLDNSEPLTEEDYQLLNFVKGKVAIILLNKSDLDGNCNVGLEEFSSNILKISAAKNQGLENLADMISKLFFDNQIKAEEELLISSLRQKESLISARDALLSAVSAIDQGFTEDIVSIDLQAAYYYLGQITGETLEEDLIDKIFSEFCLGK